MMIEICDFHASFVNVIILLTIPTVTHISSQEKDIFCCVADCGWITGHTYIVYGPLLNGSTTVMFESVPTYPNPYRCALCACVSLLSLEFFCELYR